MTNLPIHSPFNALVYHEDTVVHAKIATIKIPLWCLDRGTARYGVVMRHFIISYK